MITDLTGKAADALKAKKLPYRMVFVGDGSDMPEIQSYARQLGLEDACIFTGAIRDNDASGSRTFTFQTFDNHAVVQRTNLHLECLLTK